MISFFPNVLAPEQSLDDLDMTESDLVLVIDRSGSMDATKI